MIKVACLEKLVADGFSMWLFSAASLAGFFWGRWRSNLTCHLAFWIFSSGAKSRGWAEDTNPRPTLFSITVTLSRWIRTSQKPGQNQGLLIIKSNQILLCGIVQRLPKEIDVKGWNPHPSILSHKSLRLEMMEMQQRQLQLLQSLAEAGPDSRMVMSDRVLRGKADVGRPSNNSKTNNNNNNNNSFRVKALWHV